MANACALALEAGADLVLMKAENELVGQTVEAIRAFVEAGRLPDLDDKVYRVLELKYRYGLFYDAGDHNAPPEEVLADPAIRTLAQTVARRSVLVARDRAGLLPLPQEKRILVVEQKVKEYNDAAWHSGILYEDCLACSPNVDYLETAYTYDEEDRRRILAALPGADIIVFTSYFLRGNLSNREFLEQVIAESGKPAVVVSNTPFEEISVPRNAETVIITFATSPENIRVTAGVLFGRITPEGRMPVANGCV